jgi:hypothetical protein
MPAYLPVSNNQFSSCLRFVSFAIVVPFEFQKSNWALILKNRPTVIDIGFRYVGPYVC